MEQITEAYTHWEQLQDKLVDILDFDPNNYDSWQQVQDQIRQRIDDDPEYFQRLQTAGMSTTESPLIAAVLAQADYARLADELVGNTFFYRYTRMDAGQTKALVALLR